MALSFVQITKGDFTSSSASFARTFSSGTSAGSIIVAAGSFANNATGVTVSDNNTDAVTDSGLGVVDIAGVGARIFCKAFLTATTGTTTVTATFTGGTPGFGDLYIWEIAGFTAPAFDKFVSAAGSALLVDSGSTGTLSSATEAAIAFGCTAGVITTPGADWTTGQGSTVGSNAGDGITSNTSSIGEHRILAATTAINGTADGNGTAWGMLCATLFDGGAPPAATNLTPQIWL